MRYKSWISGMGFQWLPIVIIVLLSGCTASTKNVVVAGSVSTTSGSEKKKESRGEFPRNVAILPFLNSSTGEEGGKAVRIVVFNQFASKNY